MALFTIADLHLSLGADKPMDVFKGWENYVERLEKNWRAVVGEQDTVVVAGDISWAMKLEDTKRDFAFLQSLPGRKLLMKGNHDYWWTTKKKMDDYLLSQGFTTLFILHNNAFVEGGYSICGSRGWFYDAESDADKKVLNREAGRLSLSIEEAKKTGKEPIAFLHYPPVYGGEVCEEMMRVLEDNQINRCYYGHIHGGAAAKKALNGSFRGIDFRLVSCDTAGFLPMLVR